MIEPVDGGRPLSDRFIDRLLGWWDAGGGRSMRRALRDAVAAGRNRVRTLCAPVLRRPVMAKTLAMTTAALAAGRRWIAKAFASDVAAPTPVREHARATPMTGVDDAPGHPRPAPATRPVTAEIRTPLRSPTAEIRTPARTGTGEIRTPTRSATTGIRRTGTGAIRTHRRSATGEIPTRTATSTSRTALTPVSSAPTQQTAMTTTLRCWSCLQRNRVRTPRRGGCFLCTACNTTMLVLDPIVGLTCDPGQAEDRGIRPDRQADETDPG